MRHLRILEAVFAHFAAAIERIPSFLASLGTRRITCHRLTCDAFWHRSQCRFETLCHRLALYMSGALCMNSDKVLAWRHTDYHTKHRTSRLLENTRITLSSIPYVVVFVALVETIGSLLPVELT